MAVPFYKAISGSFVVIGKQPDGDSVRFVADNPDLYTDLHRSFRIKPSKQDGSVQLRFESVDTPELHYGKFAQPMGDTARDATLEKLGFAEISYKGNAVDEANPETIPGAILTKGADANGRPISYVLKAEDLAGIKLGDWNLVDEDILEKTINKFLIESGFAYYTVYTSTPKLHRDYLREIAYNAREESLGLWSIDATSDFILDTQDDISEKGSLILPKLFRRCTDYLKAKDQGFSGELADWLQEKSSGSRPENDPVYLEQSQVTVEFSSLIKQQNRHISLDVDTLQITFLEK
ncbi:thermonuclease family protein [Merismopedia glauca]|uniref:Nuclease n=1 Tax=Merismopedia glauca CCAP 1448/3 TaxID=1296344 RepID=A0A2T1C3U3_9CYAN|nr:thermonuclease family protein [Merismopedia glauca]PSB02921.1 nuclease [Merismopedia glauca CCAP 1448/3]